jgi:hypothetical protein
VSPLILDGKIFVKFAKKTELVPFRIWRMYMDAYSKAYFDRDASVEKIAQLTRTVHYTIGAIASKDYFMDNDFCCDMLDLSCDIPDDELIFVILESIIKQRAGNLNSRKDKLRLRFEAALQQLERSGPQQMERLSIIRTFLSHSFLSQQKTTDAGRAGIAI